MHFMLYPHAARTFHLRDVCMHFHAGLRKTHVHFPSSNLGNLENAKYKMYTHIFLLIIPACLLRSAVALPSTAPTVLPEATSAHPRCIPFEDPKCCINMAVCQCNDGKWRLFVFNPFFVALTGTKHDDLGIYYSLRDDRNTTLCNPPGTMAYDDVSNIPGWCC